MSNPLQEFEDMRRTADAAPAEAAPAKPRPLSMLDTANLIQAIRNRRDPYATPFGILTDSESFAQLQRSAQNAVERCKRDGAHRPPNCACWSDARIRLWNVRKQFPERSAEAWTAVRIWTELEEAEQRGKNAS